MESLFEAYRRTDYCVVSSELRVVIRIGEPTAVLDGWLRDVDADTWAFLTPCNPRSVELSDEENAHRLAQFRAEVARNGYEALPGEGVGQDGDWPPEPSFLVAGISREEATALATKWEQNAFVFGERGGTAELVGCPEILGEWTL